MSNLADAEFKTLIIRILKKLIGYFNNIKKTQAEMKVTLNEIKTNLQGTSSGVDETKIKSTIWNIRKKKIVNQNSKKKKRFYFQPTWRHR